MTTHTLAPELRDWITLYEYNPWMIVFTALAVLQLPAVWLLAHRLRSEPLCHLLLANVCIAGLTLIFWLNAGSVLCAPIATLTVLSTIRLIVLHQRQFVATTQPETSTTRGHAAQH